MFLKGGMSEGKLMRFEGGPINEKRNVVIDRQEVSRPVGGYNRIETTYTAKFGFDSEEAALNIAWDDVKRIKKLALLLDQLNILDSLSESNKSEIDLINLALPGKADEKNVLTRDNEDKYSPVEDYNPATKHYVDNSINSKHGELVYAARVYETSVSVSSSANVKEFVNKNGFIKKVETTSSPYFIFHLLTKNTTWVEDLEVHVTLNLSSYSDLRYFGVLDYNSGDGIRVTTQDRTNDTVDTPFWIRIYKWS